MSNRALMNANVGICLNNMACIHAKKKEYDKQNRCFSLAVKIAQDRIKKKAWKSSWKGTTSIPEEDRFKLACRQYNYGYALFKQFQRMLRKSEDTQGGNSDKKVLDL